MVGDPDRAAAASDVQRAIVGEGKNTDRAVIFAADIELAGIVQLRSRPGDGGLAATVYSCAYEAIAGIGYGAPPPATSRFPLPSSPMRSRLALVIRESPPSTRIVPSEPS